MVKAFVMVITATGTTTDILPEIEAIDGVTEANPVAGDYDVVVEVEAADTAALRPTISSQLQQIDGVGTTKTYITLA